MIVKREEDTRRKRRNTWRTVLITAWFCLALPSTSSVREISKLALRSHNIYLDRRGWLPPLSSKETNQAQGLVVFYIYIKYLAILQVIFCGSNCIFFLFIFPIDFCKEHSALVTINKLPHIWLSLHLRLWPSNTETNVFFSCQ